MATYELPVVATDALRSWERLWDVPGLANDISVVFSPRLRRSLGRATPALGRIALHLALHNGPAERLLEVLCHEAAHIAVAKRAGATGKARPRAHGGEWAALVQAAGYRSRVSVSAPFVVSAPSAARRAYAVVVHTCPVCHTERVARRVVPGWRCAECVAAGLDGVLEVTRRGARVPPERTA